MSGDASQGSSMVHNRIGGERDASNAVWCRLSHLLCCKNLRLQNRLLVALVKPPKGQHDHCAKSTFALYDKILEKEARRDDNGENPGGGREMSVSCRKYCSANEYRSSFFTFCSRLDGISVLTYTHTHLVQTHHTTHNTQYTHFAHTTQHTSHARTYTSHTQHGQQAQNSTHNTQHTTHKTHTTHTTQNTPHKTQHTTHHHNTHRHRAPNIVTTPHHTHPNKTQTQTH